MDLTDSERSTIVNALRVASERYREDATAMRDAGYTRLVAQFEHQVFEAGELAGRIEQMEN